MCILQTRKNTISNQRNMIIMTKILIVMEIRKIDKTAQQIKIATPTNQFFDNN
jgi:hypothetical protein